MSSAGKEVSLQQHTIRSQHDAFLRRFSRAFLGIIPQPYRTIGSRVYRHCRLQLCLFPFSLANSPCLPAHRTSRVRSWPTPPIYTSSENKEFLLMTASDVLVECLIDWGDRKSTRLNSSHMSISYAVFCLKKKKLDI